VVLASGSLSYLSYILVLQPVSRRSATSPSAHPAAKADTQRNAVLAQTYVLTWALLVVSLVLASKQGVGSLYWVTGWNVVLLVAVGVGKFEGMVKTPPEELPSPPPSALPRQTTANVSEGEDEDTSATSPRQHEQEPEEHEHADERTPLFRRPTWTYRSKRDKKHLIEEHEQLVKAGEAEGGGAMGWWIVQMILSVPVPAILLLHIVVIAVCSMNQAIADGGSPVVCTYLPLPSPLIRYLLKRIYDSLRPPSDVDGPPVPPDRAVRA
jgi:hypothetical protein